MQKTGKGSLCGSVLQSSEHGAAGFPCSGNGACWIVWTGLEEGKCMSEQRSPENW